MSDNKQLKGQQDRNKVNAREPYEVEDLHQKYPHLSHQTVVDAVKSHGPERKKVEAYLDGLGHKK
ncbi:DUF3606 domain-containing protein [Flavitalea sp. BT771]|uniref:DUF3606 domain-containing protein n=1 Tax=Flavitalea sp. BT771 TaxID=3063329 RepID=UPI0026E3FFFB|nr:DUF3606 domain-containing protein [Flavitalea sp. BT771]MDO6430366.1 DUF3606 domain-containing protein [Flavitalea sp. BT771]MDV6219494.1 DUF3606 domain-containing protein [Flavitalea sp. BT771]